MPFLSTCQELEPVFEFFRLAKIDPDAICGTFDIILTFLYIDYLIIFGPLDFGIRQIYGVSDFRILSLTFIGEASFFDVDISIPFDPPILSLQMNVTT